MKNLLKKIAIALLIIAVAILYYQTPGGQKALDDADKGIMTDVF